MVKVKATLNGKQKRTQELQITDRENLIKKI